MQGLKTTALKRRRTKIVATLGPASREPAMIDDLIRAGVNVFRLNMSHGTHDDHRMMYARVRAAAEKCDEPIAILADLCGPKIRVGNFAGGRIDLVNDSEVTITTRDVEGKPGLIPSQYAALAGDVKPQDRILLDDGLLELRVERVDGTEVQCRVVAGGPLKNHKGMNLPGVAVSAPALTEKDREDAKFALALGVDYLALSFVRRAADVVELKELITATGHFAHIIAKIEKPEAVDAADEILDVADGVMVARGDLGVELPPEVVPIAQRQLIAAARARHKPVIVATQMLESMIEHPRPTRAEVSDVSSAVFSGADAVMLSAETAAGAFPIKAVEMMDHVARQVESWQWADGGFRSVAEPEHPGAHAEVPLAQAVARATAHLSRDLKVRAIAVLSRTGTTARIVSVARPAAPILGITTDPGTARRMNLLWGIVPRLVKGIDLDRPQALTKRLIKGMGLADDEHYMLLVSGFHSNPDENAPIVQVLQI